MNILSFDVEEWYIEKTFKGGADWRYREYDRMLNNILDLLDQHHTKATFFCVGKLCEDFSYVIKIINERGHEIGCHSNTHQWINKMTPEEFKEDTRCAVDALEQLIGRDVISYRAPAFSIGEQNKWAFEILKECGIENDASIFPGTRDFGGFPSFQGGSSPCRLIYNRDGDSINEFPINLTSLPIVNKQIAYSGGGYFRLLPLSFVKSRMYREDYTMCYFHIADLLDFKNKFLSKMEYERYFKESGSLKNRLSRYVKANVGRKRAYKGLESLLSAFEFHSIETFLLSTTLPTVKL